MVAAYLVLGSSLGASSVIDLSLADYSFVGENSNDSTGGSVSSASAACPYPDHTLWLR